MIKRRTIKVKPNVPDIIVDESKYPFTNVTNTSELDEIQGDHDIVKLLTDVHSADIRTDISKDFVLTKLGDKDKQFVIDCRRNAQMSNLLFDKILMNEKDPNERRKIIFLKKSNYEIFMDIAKMVVILNRNTQKNFLAKISRGFLDTNEEQPMEQTATLDEETLKKLKAKVNS